MIRLFRSSGPIPLPTAFLAKRVGGTSGEYFLQQGEGARRCLLQCLPPDFSFKGKRVLDFGCGVGRVLRHFTEETRQAKFWGCDIHEPSIAWIKENIPRVRAFANGELPPLPFRDGQFDLIYAISVFTHMVESWQSWLDEMRRILKPGGIALFTYHSPVGFEFTIHKPYDEKEIGIASYFLDKSWDEGGPFVYHSNRWIADNWGSLFDIDFLVEGGMMIWQSIAVMHKRLDASPRPPAEPEILRPYPSPRWVDGFRGSIDYEVFPAARWRERHGIQAGETTWVSGWFLSQQGAVPEIRFLVGGNELPTAHLARIARPDVRTANPDYPVADLPGFEAELDTRSLPPGPYVLTVEAHDSAGRTCSVSATLVRRPAV